MREQTDALFQNFQETFGSAEPGLWSAPGRTEIGGNHTDHQRGKVLAGSVDAEMLCAAAANGSGLVCVKSEGYPLFTVDLSQLEPQPEEAGQTAALVRGMCALMAKDGAPVSGFNAYICSKVPKGSGLSSSAAFEVLIGAVVNSLFCSERYSPAELAILAQQVENVYFGKPCGLMDQMACAWGGAIAIDFADPEKPQVTPVHFDFDQSGHSLCMIDLRSDHANLTGEYAAIPAEMGAVSHFFGKSVLREVDEAEFYARLPELRAELGDRPVLRAMHFFNENRRVDAETAALNAGNFAEFLRLVRLSGQSSWLYLQNVVVGGSWQDQAAAVALALCEKLLGERGAFRIHGGGFGGTVQAFVPHELLESFRAGIEAVFGVGSCHVMRIRPEGVVRLQ